MKQMVMEVRKHLRIETLKREHNALCFMNTKLFMLGLNFRVVCSQINFYRYFFVQTK